MHINQIIIQGFKSYKDQTVIEPFSPNLNVIVGRNGSGKSNFFAAIRFVLSDAYTQMGREERQALLHEGSGSAVMSAYVEIIFDNNDERFPTGKPEVILRRTIGLKKDEYSLDRKNATKSDVMNLLESAGFSRSNPYYIVPQGRVTTLTNMKDGERLNLLKEVAGTQVYEARRTESLKIITETENKRSKIDGLLEYIKERLSELEEEKDELMNYREQDKERRCLEYTIYNREHQEIARALETIDGQRQHGVDETDENREKFLEGEKELAGVDAQIAALRQQVEFLKVDKGQLDDERLETTREKAKIELDVNAMTDGRSASQAASTRREKELESVKDQIKARERELASITPQYEAVRQEDTKMNNELAEAEGTRQRLYEKQGRTAQFSNQRQRDQWLRSEIDEVNVAMATHKAVNLETTEDVAALTNESEKIESEIAALRSRIDSRGADADDMSDEIQKVRDSRDKLMDERKELWREDAKLESVISSAQIELEKAERVLSHLMDQNTSRGLAAVRRIKARHNLEGVYGTLAELFEVPDRYRTAVEVTAGQSLFHYVVDTDATATQVLEILQKERSGRITFMPLNRLRPHQIQLPKASDAVHMISKLKFDAKFEPAFQQVFGKTIVCPNLQVAAQYARSHAVTAITPEGDRADRKGALTGGYHDPRSSRLEAVRNVAKWRNECESHRSRREAIRREVEIKQQEASIAVGELQRLEHSRQRTEDGYGSVAQELRNRTLALQAARDSLQAKQQVLANAEAAIRELSDQQAAYEQELAAPYLKALSAAEEAQLHELSTVVPDLRKRAAALSVRRSELEGKKAGLEAELQENLRLQLDQLHAQDLDSGAGKTNAQLKERSRELKRVDQALAGIDAKLREAEDSIEAAEAELAETMQKQSDLQKDQESLARDIERYQKRLEKSMAKKALLTEKSAECNRSIRELGALPQEAFRKYKDMPSDRAIKRLHKVNEGLKKYSHVNKKAFEQYETSTKQRDLLIKRREELSSSHGSITELIDVLDQRKDEAIERTFKQVSKEFAGVFERLVPAGKGRLIIQRKSDGAQQRDGDESDDERRQTVENYIGVGISVSFNSKHDEQQRIQQLSGGQKSLCALALVFAIQKCDPAPFYLFDEIDANLDAQYRTAVAQMLDTISQTGDGGQFICTTFRPEMVLVAEKCYGVAYSNKTSSIDVVDRELALDFVEGEKQ